MFLVACLLLPILPASADHFEGLAPITLPYPDEISSSLTQAKQWLYKLVSAHNAELTKQHKGYCFVTSAGFLKPNPLCQSSQPTLFMPIAKSYPKNFAGWTSESKAKTPQTKVKTFETFIPVYARMKGHANEGKKEMQYIAGLLHYEIDVYVQNDDGEWVKESEDHDEDYYKIAYFSSKKIYSAYSTANWALTPEQNYVLWHQSFAMCNKMQFKATQAPDPEEWKVFCSTGVEPIDSNGDNVADSGLSENEVYTILQPKP